MGNSKLLKTDAFQEAAEKIRKETPGIITNESSFDPGNPDQTGLVEDIYEVNLAITDIPYRKDERTFLPLNLTPPNPNKPWTFPDILTSLQNDIQM